MYLSAQEKEDLVFEADVTHEGHGKRRWSEYTTTVVQKDGKFYCIGWDRGLTENQDNEFEDGDVPEVFPVQVLKVKAKTHYLTEEALSKSKPSLAQKLLGEAESYSIVTGKSIAEPVSDEVVQIARALKDLLPDLKPLDIAADSGSYREATLQYLEALIALAEGEQK